MNHEVEISNLMFNKTSEKGVDFKKYDINVDLVEEVSDEDKTVLKFSLDLTSNPKNSVINLSGNATLTGDKSEIEEFLKQETETTPEVVSLIYQELFPLMYIISKNMNIPSPAHTLSQNNVGIHENQDTELESNEAQMENEPLQETVEKTENNEMDGDSLENKPANNVDEVTENNNLQNEQVQTESEISPEEPTEQPKTAEA